MLTLGVGIAWTALPREALADGTARLAWVRGQGADQCPDATAVRTAVNARAGRLALADDAPQSVEAIVTALSHVGATAHWQAQLYVRDANGMLIGRRDLATDARGCGALVDIVAFAIVVALDADAGASGGPPPSVPELTAPSSSPSAAPSSPPPPAAVLDEERPTVPQPGSTEPARVRPSVAPVPDRPRLEASFGVRFTGDVGLQPGVTPGGAVSVDVTAVGWPTLRAVLSYWPESIEPAGTGSVGIRYDLATVVVCPALVRLDQLRLEACAGLTGGVLTGAGHGFTMNTIADTPFFAPQVGLAARQRIGPIYIEAGVDAAVPVPHDEVMVQNLGTVWSPSYVVGSVFAGVGVVFR